MTTKVDELLDLISEVKLERDSNASRLQESEHALQDLQV
jgi:hypothetical protein